MKITEDLILLNVEAEDKISIINKLSELLYEKSIVKKSFLEAIQKRESVFPTGLPTEDIGVAIPHTDTEHVNESAIAIATLNKPIKFEVMGSPGNFTDVKIVIMLAVKDSNSQLQLLKNLMDMMQDKNLLRKIINSKNKSEVKEILKQKLIIN